MRENLRKIIQMRQFSIQKNNIKTLIRKNNDF